MQEIEKGKYKITVVLLENYIGTQFVPSNIVVDEKRNIILNKVIVTHLFSKKEKALLMYLFINSNKLLARDSIAQAVWKEEYYTNYTDWSLDQLIRRLRLKLVKLGLQKSCIETKKNQGYIFHMSK